MSIDDERPFDVKYQYATYSGTERVWAEDEEQAIAKAKRRLKKHMSLPMAYESWKATEVAP